MSGAWVWFRSFPRLAQIAAWVLLFPLVATLAITQGRNRSVWRLAAGITVFIVTAPVWFIAFTSGGGPTAAERAGDHIEAAWSATEMLDPDLAEAELQAALQTSPTSVAPIQPELERRIAAVRLWNAAEAAVEASDYLTAIGLFDSAVATDDFFRVQAQIRSRNAEDLYVQASARAIENLLSLNDAEGAFAAFTTARGDFPDNPAFAELQSAVTNAILPVLFAELEGSLQGTFPEGARARLNSVVNELGADDRDDVQMFRVRINEAIERNNEARRLEQEASRRAAEERSRLAEERARQAAEDAQRARQAIFDKIACVRDDRERVNRCYDRSTYTRTPTNRLYLWTFEEENGTRRLNLALQTTGSNWIFWERARIYVGNSTYDINAGFFNVQRDNGSRSTWETYSRRATSADLAMLAEISRSSEAYIRFINSDNRYREHQLTRAQINAIGNMLAYWAEVR